MLRISLPEYDGFALALSLIGARPFRPFFARLISLLSLKSFYSCERGRIFLAARASRRHTRGAECVA